MTESQYARYKEMPRHSLGLMSNQIWHEDPKMLGIHLARYKFVAKMLAGKTRVAEVGCGDGFYSRIVEKEVVKLDLYDFDPQFSAENDKITTQNILFHPVSNKYSKEIPGLFKYESYDAIFSLDVLEHIKPEDENIYMRNIRGSLTKSGIFIVGMPSRESQRYASEDSKAGHVNCKSGDDLKKLLQRYFENVFLFSMNDEVIHTGFYPMAHYLIAICCGVK